MNIKLPIVVNIPFKSPETLVQHTFPTLSAGGANAAAAGSWNAPGRCCPSDVNVG